MKQYIDAIRDYSRKTYSKMVRDPKGYLKYPFIVPGSESYGHCLWDWDSWLTDIAVRQIMLDNGVEDAYFTRSEKGCILNFLELMEEDGRTMIVALPDRVDLFDEGGNIHKPCLIQHAAFVTQVHGEDGEWLRPHMEKFDRFLNYYMTHCRHGATGLYFWLNDTAIGVDNDPCTFYRPFGSSASIYLNCLMYKELLAMVYLCDILHLPAAKYQAEADALKKAIQTHLWDERDGFYYSADLNLLPVDPDQILHSGAPRHWHCLIQRIDVWSGFMAMWAGIATEAQAKRMVARMEDPDTFRSPYGIRSLSKMEAMYNPIKSGNPSCWLGPIWGIVNWMCFVGLLNYGYEAEAKKLCEDTIGLFGRDILFCGEMHEYYHPDTGEGMNNQGFQSWNFLVNNMSAWYEGKDFVRGF